MQQQQPGSVKSNRPKSLSKKTVKKKSKLSGVKLTTTFPPASDDFHDDSSARSLSSSYSGFSASVSRLDNIRSQDMILNKVCVCFSFSFKSQVKLGTFVQDNQNDIAMLKIQLSDILEENSTLKTRFDSYSLSDGKFY